MPARQCLYIESAQWCRRYYFEDALQYELFSFSLYITEANVHLPDIKMPRQLEYIIVHW